MLQKYGDKIIDGSKALYHQLSWINMQNSLMNDLSKSCVLPSIFTKFLFFITTNIAQPWSSFKTLTNNPPVGCIYCLPGATSFNVLLLLVLSSNWKLNWSIPSRNCGYVYRLPSKMKWNLLASASSAMIAFSLSLTGMHGGAINCSP